MATELVLRPIHTDTAKSSQENFAQLLYWYYCFAVLWSPSMFTASSASTYDNFGVIFYPSNRTTNNLDNKDLALYSRSLVNKVISPLTSANSHQDNYEALTPPESRSKVRELISLLELEPIEDGYFHPAEKLIEESLQSCSFDPNHWVYTAFFENINSRSMLAAAILRCLGRLSQFLVGQWGVFIALSGLSHNEVEVREAAVRALEHWGGHEALEGLKSHVDAEPTHWLAAYMRDVIMDLTD